MTRHHDHSRLSSSQGNAKRPRLLAEDALVSSTLCDYSNTRQELAHDKGGDHEGESSFPLESSSNALHEQIERKCTSIRADVRHTPASPTCPRRRGATHVLVVQHCPVKHSVVNVPDSKVDVVPPERNCLGANECLIMLQTEHLMAYCAGDPTQDSVAINASRSGCFSGPTV